MTPLEFIVLLLIAGVCGALSQVLVGYSHGGCLASIALGFVGALLGTWLARVLELPELFTVDVGGHRFPIVWSIMGGALFAAILSLFAPRPVVRT